jgi:hypothetical protein
VIGPVTSYSRCTNWRPTRYTTAGPGIELLRKRKVELTQRDADVMERVVDFVLTQEAEGPDDAENDEEWRRSLMTVGHDPTRP